LVLYDRQATEVLKWTPRYASWDEFCSKHAPASV
jgi:hypothetical protein